MRTLVYQSYCMANVRRFIARCLETARAWADAQGFDHEFIDDRIIEVVPRSYFDKVRGRILLVVDLA
ncbi:MAG: hypothetical protein WAN51_13520, partial [Alphaproteobacteria bacterium]